MTSHARGSGSARPSCSRDGQVFADREPAAAEHLKGSKVVIGVDMGAGGTGERHRVDVWISPLSTFGFNADYRT